MVNEGPCEPFIFRVRLEDEDVEAGFLCRLLFFRVGFFSFSDGRRDNLSNDEADGASARYRA
jgi:hypothetical protein